jgi:flagellar biosynthesis anti-sigma factor FlgM
MEIKGIPIFIDQKAAERSRETVGKVVEQTRPDSTRGASTDQASDRVRLSRQSQEISLVKKVAMELPDIRSERVDLVRNMIENGEYVVKHDDIVKKLLDEIT